MPMPVGPHAGRRLNYALCRSPSCRSGVEPPTGTIHPRQISSYAPTPGHNPFGVSPALTPVGGIKPCRSPSYWSGVAPPTLSRSHAGRGLNPRPERSIPAKYLPTLPIPATIHSEFPPPSYRSGIKPYRLPSYWSGVAPPTLSRSHAGRGLNPRPERSTPAKYLPTLPIPATIHSEFAPTLMPVGG